MKILRRKLAILVLVVGSGACTSLPDTSGFTVATSQLSSAIGAAGDAAHTQLVAAGGDIRTASVRQQAERDAQNFDAAWDRTVAASRRMVDYAESIEAITTSASEAPADIDAVAGSLGELATAAGIANPLAGETGGAIVAIAREVWTQVRLAQAAGDLKAAIAAADPAVQRITVHLEGQLADLTQLWTAAMDSRRNHLNLHYGNADETFDRLNRDYSVMLADYAEARGSEREQLRQRIAASREQYESAREIAQAYAREDAELTTARDNGLRLIAETADALASWRRAHDRLRTAIEERKPVSMQSLLAAAQRVRAVVEDLRDDQ